MATIILILLIAACVAAVYYQGTRIEYYRKSLDDEIKTRELLTKHIDFLEEESKKYEVKMREYEDHLNSLKFESDWKLRDSPTTAIDKLTNPARDKKS